MLYTKYPLPSDTVKFVWINNTKTGNNIAAPTEPIDTIWVNAISNNAKTRHIKPICQFVINNTPNDVARLNQNIEKYAEAVVKAVAEYIGVPYTPPDSSTSPNPSTYIVQSGDTIFMGNNE